MQIPSDDTHKASIDGYKEAVAFYNLINTHGELGARLIAYFDNDSDDTHKASIDWYEEALALYNLLNTHGELGARLIPYFDNDIELAQKAIDDHYCGKYSSIADFARNLTEETYENIPSNIAYYIDYERMAQDMLLGGDIFVIEMGYDEVHIFSNF